jgi:hypothetical protein
MTRYRIALVIVVHALVAVAAGQTVSSIEGLVKDTQSLPVAGVSVRATETGTSVERITNTNTQGFYRLAALPAGTYTLVASDAGFDSYTATDLQIPVNSVLRVDITLRAGSVHESITVSTAAPLLDTESSSSTSIIQPQQIEDMPINGRNYVDLLQLVPGVAVNSQSNAGSDTATAVLGERGGNTKFLIDGLPNSNSAFGGADSQFDQNTIAEFQVITAGYEAEFGQASGGVVNVITKRGENKWHGFGSLFHRNNAFDSTNNSLRSAPGLRRFDYDLGLGGPIVRDKVFFFASAERIEESRILNFTFPSSTPQPLANLENSFNNPSLTHDTRLFGRLDEKIGHHLITEEVNHTISHVSDFLPLSEGGNLPSTRETTSSRSLLTGIGDTVLLGDQANPFVLVARLQYREDTASFAPSHPQAGAGQTTWFPFSSLTTGTVFGDLPNITFGTGQTASQLLERYISPGISVGKQLGRHNLKFGYDLEHLTTNGVEDSQSLLNLFATVSDFGTFGPLDSGFFSHIVTSALTPQGNSYHLHNYASGLYFQDDWKLANNITVNLGLRWDYDSAFPSKTNLSPRVGFAWAVRPHTVVRGSFGEFYDHFRLGLAKEIPAFGGVDEQNYVNIGYPRLFYGDPSPALLDSVGICVSPTLTDQQIAATGATCPFGPMPYYGTDHLNNIMGSGHASIPANSVVTVNNVQSLTGLSPQQYADQASAAVGQSPGFFGFYDSTGVLSQVAVPAGRFPITVDPNFKTPYTQSFSLGLDQLLADNLTVGISLYHKDIRNILGVRETNLAFQARLPGQALTLMPGTGTALINGYGPWFKGTYNSLIISVNKRFSHRFSFGGFFSWTNEIDNANCSDFPIAGSPFCLPSDDFVGTVPVVTDPNTGQTNANGSFVASNNIPIPKAGIFWNGPDVDRGSSPFALRRTLVLNGTAELPGRVQFSPIFRVQSGFPFSRFPASPLDLDGDQTVNFIDYSTGRNHFTAPSFRNLDMRISRVFRVRERLSITPLFEFFNLFNARNPAAVEPQMGTSTPFGQPLQVLPGREGQIGLKIDF